MTAIYWLNLLRVYNNPLCTKFYLDDFCRSLAKEGKTVVDVGTSMEELEHLCENGYLRAALYYVENVRKRVNPSCDSFYIYEIKRSLKMTHLNLWERIKLTCGILDVPKNPVS